MLYAPRMTDEATSLVLEMLRHIRSQVDDVRERLIAVERRLTVIEGHMASLVLGQAGHNSEIDMIKSRLDRIEGRLELAN